MEPARAARDWKGDFMVFIAAKIQKMFFNAKPGPAAPI
jgi:hypothetical protein